MAEFNRRERVIKLKIAYYGPAVGGKTTNLKYLYDHARSGRRGDFVSVNSEQDRTILCDLLPLKSPGFLGFDLRFQLAAVPGQAMYVAARRVVLRGSDAVVFVANSATDRWHENLQSFRELEENLVAQQIDPATVPLVLQYNKRDLPDVLELEALDRALNARRAPTIAAVATRGEGVLETFASAARLAVDELIRRYPTLQGAGPRGTDDWVRQTMATLFRPGEEQTPEEPGPLELGDALFEAAPPERVMVRVAMPEERPGGAAGDARAPEVLAESYAQASTELGFAVTDLRDARDVARSRLAELRVALELAEQKTGEGEIEDRAQRILSILLRAAAGANASLLLTTTDPPQILVRPPLVTDPLARTHWGALHLHELRNLGEPRLEEGRALPELAQALGQVEPLFESIALVPLRSAERLLALALIYFRPHMALPTADTLTHLGFLGRVLAGPLEATAAKEAGASAERLRVVSRVSAQALASLMTRMPAAALRRQPTTLEDLLSPLRAAGVTVTVPPGSPPVSGEPSLLRFAVATLVQRCEAAALERSLSPAIAVYAGAEEGRVRIHVWLGEGEAVVGAPTVPSAADADAETTAVQAVMALHGGHLIAPASPSASVYFILELPPAAA